MSRKTLSASASLCRWHPNRCRCSCVCCPPTLKSLTMAVIGNSSPNRPSKPPSRQHASPPRRAASNNTNTTSSSSKPLLGRLQSLSPPQNAEDVRMVLLILALATMAIYLAMQLVVRFIKSLPLFFIALYFLKPRVETFIEFLLLGTKKDQQTATKDENKDRTTSPIPAGGWLLGIVHKTIEKTSAALFLNPAREWLYLDLGLFILCKRKPRALGELTGAIMTGNAAAGDPKVFACGVFFNWFMLDPTVSFRRGHVVQDEWFFLKAYVYNAACVFASYWPDEKWQDFTTLAAAKRQERRRSAENAMQSSIATAVASVEGVWKEAAAAAVAAGTPGAGGRVDVRSSSPIIEESDRMEERSIRRHMQRAQEYAEKGRFLEAGKAVEAGLSKCRTFLRGGVEEETELLLVAAAFFEAGAPTSYICATAHLRCLEDAAELCVIQQRWAKASELFEECVLGLVEGKKQGEAAYGHCVLSAVLSQFMFGDAVKAEALFKSVCKTDPKFLITAEGALISGLLKGIHKHDKAAIEAAKRGYKKPPGKEHRLPHREAAADGKSLEQWQEHVIRHMMKRAENPTLT